MCNTYCFTTPSAVTRTCPTIAFIGTFPVWLIPNVVFQFLYVSLISGDFCNNTLILPFYYFYIQASFVELAFHFRSFRWQHFVRQQRGYVDCVSWLPSLVQPVAQSLSDHAINCPILISILWVYLGFLTHIHKTEGVYPLIHILVMYQ